MNRIVGFTVALMLGSLSFGQTANKAGVLSPPGTTENPTCADSENTPTVSAPLDHDIFEGSKKAKIQNADKEPPKKVEDSQKTDNDPNNP